MEIKNDVIITPAIIDANTFFIFRESGVEVKVKVSNGNIVYASRLLSEIEQEEILKNVIINENKKINTSKSYKSSV